MLIGIDAGGTSTRAVVLDRTGRCLGLGRGGAGNPVAVGPERALSAIRDATQQAIRHAGLLGIGDAAAIGDGSGGGTRGGAGHDADGGSAVLAMAGGRGVIAPEVMATQVREIAGVAAVEVISDVAAMFAAGTPKRRGYVLVSGTGAAALRMEQGRVAATADGLGWLLGDAGSGFWIGHHAVRAALAALSGHGPATEMADLLLAELGLEADRGRTPRGRLAAVESAIETFYQIRPIELARYASIAFAAARVPDRGGSDADAEPGPGAGACLGAGVGSGAGRGTDAGRDGGACAAPDADPVAVGILRAATDQLVRTLAAVQVPEIPGPVVLGGTIARRLPGLAAAVRESFGAGADPQVCIVPDGVAGAAMLALAGAGITVDDAMFERVTSTLAALRRQSD
jgi:N-acetylglucosamine kinase-like BadF-type ATPase